LFRTYFWIFSSCHPITEFWRLRKIWSNLLVRVGSPSFSYCIFFHCQSHVSN
jgi:hypothetical protein